MFHAAFLASVFVLGQVGNCDVSRKPVSRLGNVTSPKIQINWRERDLSLDVVQLINGLGDLVGGIDLSDTAVNANTLEQLQGLTALKSIDLDRCECLKDEDVVNVPNLDNIESISFLGAPLTSESIAFLVKRSKSLESQGKCLKLKRLIISGPAFGDENIEILCQLPNLKSVSMVGTKVTSLGIERLKKLRPELEVLGYFKSAINP